MFFSLFNLVGIVPTIFLRPRIYQAGLAIRAHPMCEPLA